ncbi:MAG: hypothetical protein R3C20_19735 [Planctomycetaceae bacterium]
MTAQQWMVAIVVGCALAGGVWNTLLMGGGLVGGDTYPYFFPQKQMMADAFHRGEIPLWHDRTGLGYPLHAESQAGIFYPTNQILYRVFDVNRAYSLSVILHYAAAFTLAWRFARTQTLSNSTAHLAALIYVYGWFPARVSLEWSIIGGVWFPAALWMTDRCLRLRNRRSLISLAVVLAIHLLAGHFALAFVTQLTCCVYALIRTISTPTPHPGKRLPSAAGSVAGVVTAILLALLISSVQLLPTIELKRMSQREGTNEAFDPAYGHMPPLYMTQLFASWWYWHTPEMVLSRAITNNSPLSISSATNQVEAHLYFGLIPFSLLLCLINPAIRARVPRNQILTWCALLFLSLIYSTGWLVILTKYLPGFGFFMGPARYSIVAALAGGILSASVLDTLVRRRSPAARLAVISIIGAVTLADVLKSSEAPVRDAVQIEDAPYNSIEQSWIRDFIASNGEAYVRLLAPGPNVANLFGTSCIPQYLGIGPADYYTDEKTYRTQPESGTSAVFPTDEELSRLELRGVTHILTTESIAVPHSGIELLNAAPDAFLNRVWGRGMAPVYLYRIRRQPSRITTDPPESSVEHKWISRTPQKAVFECRVNQSCSVQLLELMYPGWKVYVDDIKAEADQPNGFRRSVRIEPGTHRIEWRFESASFTTGCLLSTLGLMIAIAMGYRDHQNTGVSLESRIH